MKDYGGINHLSAVAKFRGYGNVIELLVWKDSDDYFNRRNIETWVDTCDFCVRLDKKQWGQLSQKDQWKMARDALICVVSGNPQEFLETYDYIITYNFEYLKNNGFSI